jgi:hypothetical protein
LSWIKNILIGFAIATLVGATLPDARVLAFPKNLGFGSETPRPAQQFVDSIGVNTHISYFDTSYGNIAVLQRELKLLGVRHVRDGAVLQNDDYNKTLYDDWHSLSEFGVRFNMCLDPRGSIKTVEPATIQRLLDLSGPSVESIEGPNELDVSKLHQWAALAKSYQQEISAAVPAVQGTSKIALIGPSMAFIANGEMVGSLSGLVTYGNLHPYPAGAAPAQMLNSQIAQASNIYPDKPLVITETGYHNAVNGHNGQPGVSEAAASKYIPRLLLETFNIGIIRTYLYEFEDEFPDPGESNQERHWGLLRSDGSEKPAFAALRNLIAILTASPTTKAPTLSPLTYAIEGNNSSLHHTLLQGRDSSYYLALWQEVSSYDTRTKEDLDVAAEPIKIDLRGMYRLVTIYDTLHGTAPVAQMGSPASLSVAVPDHVIIVKISR